MSVQAGQMRTCQCECAFVCLHGSQPHQKIVGLSNADEFNLCVLCLVQIRMILQTGDGCMKQGQVQESRRFVYVGGQLRTHNSQFIASCTLVISFTSSHPACQGLALPR